MSSSSLGQACIPRFITTYPNGGPAQATVQTTTNCGSATPIAQCYGPATTSEYIYCDSLDATYVDEVITA